jgi:hypothetical protein
VQGKLTEYTVIADRARLEVGEVFLDVPAYLAQTPIAYTPDEYAAHFSHIRQIERESNNYRLAALPMSPFANIKVMYKKDALTVVEKMGTPAAAFAFDNPFMCSGFEGFFAELEKRTDDMRL